MAAAPSVRGEELPAVSDPKAAIENGTKRSERGFARVAADAIILQKRALVARRLVDAHHFRGKSAVLGRRGGQCVALRGEAILRGSRDPVLLGHLLRGVPHRKSGGVFRNSRRPREEVLELQTSKRPETLRKRLCLARRNERLAHAFETGMGILESDSVPPAMTTSAWPEAIDWAALAIA